MEPTQNPLEALVTAAQEAIRQNPTSRAWIVVTMKGKPRGRSAEVHRGVRGRAVPHPTEPGQMLVKVCARSLLLALERDGLVA